MRAASRGYAASAKARLFGEISMPGDESHRSDRNDRPPNYVLYDKLNEVVLAVGTVDRKVDRIDQRVTEVVLARLEQLERRVDNHEKKFERVNIKVYGFMAGSLVALGAITKAAGAW